MIAGCHGNTFLCILTKISIFWEIFLGNIALNQICYNFPKQDSVSGLSCVSMQNQETKALKAETFETKHETMRHAWDIDPKVSELHPWFLFPSIKFPLSHSSSNPLSLTDWFH